MKKVEKLGALLKLNQLELGRSPLEADEYVIRYLSQVLTRIAEYDRETELYIDKRIAAMVKLNPSLELKLRNTG